MRYLVTCSYDGTFFHGFQRQKYEKNVQGTIENAISEILKQDVVIKGAGRTDAKVHALGQAFHFDSLTLPKHFQKILNLKLSPEIHIKGLKKVDENFHARHNAKGKIYCYKINLGSIRDKYNGYVYQPKYKIDIAKIKEIKNLFLGTHDFHNFVAGKRDNYVTTIYNIKIKKKHNILEIYFYGKAFYRYMVRNLVGALIFYSRGKVSEEMLKQMLDDPSFNKEIWTAPSEGLYLVKVIY